jgi:predicted double-glycine peptidase
MIAKAILESVGVLFLACLCAWAGVRVSRMKPTVWIAGFFVPFTIVFSIVLLNRVPLFVYNTYFAWIAEGRNEYLLMAACMPFIFGILVPRLRQKRQKIAVILLVVVGSFYFIFPPFIDPVLLYNEIKKNDLWIEDGVCLQTTNYTCGAVSAVTALLRFGIHASEAELAMASFTSRTWGTSASMLAGGIEKLYAKDGITCEVRGFDTVEALKDVCPVLMIIKHGPLMDHYVAVLEVTEDAVIIGDPSAGKEALTYEEFMKKWRQVGIVISKNGETI